MNNCKTDNNELVERVARALACTFFHECSRGVESTSVAATYFDFAEQYVDKRWDDFNDMAKAAIAAMGDAAIRKDAGVGVPGTEAEILATSPHTLNESLYAALTATRRHCKNSDAVAQADEVLAAYDSRSEIPVVDEKEVRKRIASELTRCAETADSHDWNDQTHRQRIVNAVILAVRPYLREPKREICPLSDDDKKEIVSLMVARAEAMGEISVQRSMGSALSALLSDPRYEIRRRV